MRDLLTSRRTNPQEFLQTLRSIPAAERDLWLDQVLDLEDLPEDGPELPRGCVPYLPCSVSTLLRAIDLTELGENDVFVDIGSGLGRATALAHFATGAGAIGIEVQSKLVRAARDLAARLNAPRVAVIEGDATQLARYVAVGSVFFLYCPFGPSRASQVLDGIEWMAKIRDVRICSVDLPLPPRPWLAPISLSDGLSVYRSRPWPMTQPPGTFRLPRSR